MSAIVLRNGRIGAGGRTGDLVIEGGEVTRAGGRADLRGAEIVHLDGATVLPGLWDSHVHSVQWALARRRIDLSSARSAREAAELAAKAATERPGELVSGYGFRDGLWPDTPHKDLLAADKPMVLVSNDLHAAWLSRPALALVGLGDHPTGLLREHDCFDVMARLPAATQAQLDAWVIEATQAAAARGVVGILDFELADNVTDWLRRAGSGQVAVRVVCSVPQARLDDAIQRNLRTGDLVPGGGGLLQVGPVKLFIDGSLNTRTAYCADPYPADGGTGLLATPSAELASVMRRAAANGLHPAVHAIGDLANAMALEAFESVGCPGRIEHAQLVRDTDLARFARPRLVTSVQPAHCPDDRDIADRHWRGRTGRAFPYGRLLEAGAVLEFGSDAPVAPLDPWDGIAAAVTRTDDDRPPWPPEQAVPVTDALAASSRGRRTVAAGSPADLVIVPEDPARVDAASLRAMPVLGTLLAGHWTYLSDSLG
jgi:predicted amidohydrolase YtcJ